MAELDSGSVSTMIHRLVKQLLGQWCAAWRHACDHRIRDLLLLCSYKENGSNAFEFTHSRLMAGRGYRLINSNEVSIPSRFKNLVPTNTSCIRPLFVPTSDIVLSFGIFVVAVTEKY